MPTTAINTKKIQSQRAARYESLDELLAETERARRARFILINERCNASCYTFYSASSFTPFTK